MDDYLINGETLENIADKIREKAPEAYEGNTVTPEEMPDAVDEVWQAGYNEGSKSVDLSSYQTKHDENLKTESKEIVDAINELKEILGEGAIDGKTPYIQDGYWYIDGVNTNVKAQGENGKDGADGKDGKDGTNGIDGKDGNDYVLTEADKEEIAEIVAENISPSENKPTDLTGLTFVLKEDIGEKLYYTVGAKYNVNFTSNGEDFIGFELCHDSDDADDYTHLQYWLSNTQGRNVYIYTRSSNSGNFSNNEYRTVTFTGGADVKNPDLIELIYSIGVIESPYQTKTDENLATESKEIVGAINELDGKYTELSKKVENIPPPTDNSKPTNLKGLTYNIPSGWGARSTYGQFSVNCDIVVGETPLTKTRLSLGFTIKGTIQSILGLTNSIVVDNGSGLGAVDGYVIKNTNGFTITFNDGDTTNTSLIDWVTTLGELQVPEYQTKTDENLETESKGIVGAINELNDKINAIGGGSTEEMPQIRFVSMPCDGWFGYMCWEEIDGTQDVTYENLKFTIEIVSGTLQVGDAIQLCRMGHYGAWRNKITGKTNPDKRKLRRLFEYVITEDDLDKRFITFEVPWDDKKAIKLFTKWATSGVNDKTIYFRIRRPKGEINSGSNGGGMTVDAEFSNVVSIRCLSYTFTWYPSEDEGVRFHHIRIT